MEMGKGRIVETISLTKTLGMLKRGFYIDLTVWGISKFDYLIILITILITIFPIMLVLLSICPN